MREEYSPCSSHLCLLFVPPLEKTECWRFKKRRMVCVEGGGSRGCRSGRGGGRGTLGGAKQPALVWVRGNGRHRGDGLPAGAQHHGSFVWAAAAHGWVSNHYMNICKQIKKQTHWAQMETSASLFPTLSPSPLLQSFPRGRSGWLLAPQSSPDPISSTILPPMTTTVCRQEPVCKTVTKPWDPFT